MKFKLVSSLEKCFLDEDINTKAEFTSGSCLKNEFFRFGICYKNENYSEIPKPVRLTVNSQLGDRISISRVEHLPVKFPVYNQHEKFDFLRTTPGLYPDLITPVNKHNRLIVSYNLESLFVEVDTRGISKAGIYNIEFVFSDFEDKQTIEKLTFELEIIDCELPEQALIFTQWLHCDSLVNYYKTEAFDERHWSIIENYLKTAVKHGINMVLTPIFTPALDTYVGGERETTQLVDITVTNGEYSFGFEKLERWINLCKRLGIKYFEMSHLFTQWGCAHAPKIIANVNGECKKIFGWETNADSTEYKEFLEAFLPQLIAFLKEHGIKDNTVFHISDEPNVSQISNYLTARKIVEPLLEGCEIIDAVSDYEFYSNKICTRPIPDLDHIEDFIKNNVPNLFTYYCCIQYDKLSNRFLSMPSYRNRIIGIQMYKYNIKGFLHWGYNFYGTQLSYAETNPYLCMDAEYGFPAGDAFSVYPAPDGTAYESVRLKVFHDALQDISALSLCEKLYSKEFVMSLIDENCENEITFREYPRSNEYLLTLREKVNCAIKEKI